MSSIKKQIEEKNNNEPFEFAEYENLILDEMNIGQISDEDKEFLEKFTECACLSLNCC